MSLKENIEYIKEEISSEEKFFESFFKLEKFYKKYKYIIIALLVGTLAYVIGSNVINYINEQNTIKANNAYNRLLINPSDDKSIEILKQKNKKLLDIANFLNTKDKTKKVDIIYLDLITQYNKAIKDNDIKALDRLIINSDFILRDYAIFSKALILVQNKQYSKAKNTLKNIPKNSQVNSLSSVLNHFLLTK